MPHFTQLRPSTPSYALVSSGTSCYSQVHPVASSKSQLNPRTPSYIQLLPVTLQYSQLCPVAPSYIPLLTVTYTIPADNAQAQPFIQAVDSQHATVVCHFLTVPARESLTASGEKHNPGPE